MDATPYCRKVYYYETDQMSIVHHSNYIRWMEEARTDYMRKNGVDYHDVEAHGIIMPVLGVSCRYRVSARYDDPIAIRTALCYYNGVRARYRYEIRHGETGVLLAEGESEHCFLDAESRVPLKLKKTHPDYSRHLETLLAEEAGGTI